MTGKKDIEVAKINIKKVDTVLEEYPSTNMEDENIIDKEDISMGETNEKAMTEIITVNSKEDDDTLKLKLLKRVII